MNDSQQPQSKKPEDSDKNNLMKLSEIFEIFQTKDKNIWEQLKRRFGWLVLFGFISTLGVAFDLITSVGIEPNIKVETVVDEDDPNKTRSISKIDYPFHYSLLRAFSTLLYTLSTSLFVSVFVISVLENIRIQEEEKKLIELRNAINNDVFDSLFKTLMPDEIFKVLKSQIIENKIIRRNAKWIHVFEKNNQQNTIELKQTIKYELHNLSREPVPNPLTIKYQQDIDCSQELIRAQCKTPNGRIIFNHPPKKNENCEAIKEIYEDKSITGIRFNMEIPPQNYMEIEIEFFYKYSKGVQGDYFTMYPVIDAELYVYFPKDYKFSIFNAMSSPLIKKIDQEGYCLFESKGGILPRQGFIYKLEPKNTSSVSHSHEVQIDTKDKSLKPK